MKKGRNFSQSFIPYIPYCFSSVEYLLFKSYDLDCLIIVQPVYFESSEYTKL